MSFFQDLGKRVSDTTDKAVKKVKEYTETAKVNSQLSEAVKSANEAYADLGRQYMAKYGNSADPAFSQAIQKIRIAEGDIAKCQAELARISPKRRCPNCGAEVSEDAAFCATCGSKIQ